MTNLDAIMLELEQLGTAQNRKIYTRHGVGPQQFGVSVANIKALKKRIKRDHALALALWSTGNHDARILATHIADPAQATRDLLLAWAHDLDSYVITDALTAYIRQTPLAMDLMAALVDEEGEWLGSLGWSLLGALAYDDRSLHEDFFWPYLDTIERDIHTRKNRVRYSMNNALIAIGMRGGDLQTRALAVAKAIGTVEVDHGETSCKTPDAASYMLKTKPSRGA